MKKIFSLLAALFLVFMTCVPACAERDPTLNLPDSFDARDKGWVSPVKTQKENDCWANTICALAESSVLSQGLEKEVDFSEAYYVYFRNNYSKYIDEEGGGNFNILFSSLSKDYGLAYERDFNYGNYDSINENKILTNPCKYEVEYAGYVENVKAWVYKNGAVGCSIYMDETKGEYPYVNNVLKTQDETNHEMAIVGWDDNFRFSDGLFYLTAPVKRGAWICKNSWGTKAGKDGYFYVSYEDSSLCNFTGVIIREKTSSAFISYNEHYCSKAAQMTVKNEAEQVACSYANAFPVTKDLVITDFSFLAFDNAAFTYTLYFTYSLDNITDMSQNKKYVWTKILDGTVNPSEFDGYNYLKIPINTIMPDKGYAVIVITPDNDFSGVFVDDGGYYLQSFYGIHNDEYAFFYDMYDSHTPSNFYINMYTRDLTQEDGDDSLKRVDIKENEQNKDYDKFEELAGENNQKVMIVPFILILVMFVGYLIRKMV